MRPGGRASRWARGGTGIGDGEGLRDLTTGRVLTARREPSLLFARAELRNGLPVIVLPDGTETADDEELTDWLGRPVALERAGAEGGTYETPLDVEHEDGAWSE